MQSTAYLCSDMNSFSQGLCLSCKKGHCNTLGYHIRQEWHGKKSRKLFLMTRAQSPFKGERVQVAWSLQKEGCSHPSEGSEVPCSLSLQCLQVLLL